MKENLAKLIRIREQLVCFHISACGLKHEEVIKAVHDRNNVHPDFPDYRFTLHGLCPKSIRNKTLNCAHSMAAVYYERLILQLRPSGIFNSFSALSDLLKTHLLKIYKLDHEKGNLEKKLACSKHAFDAGKEKEIETKLQNLHQEHAMAVARVKEIHLQIIKGLDSLISSKN